MFELVDVHLAETLEPLPLDVLGFAIARRKLSGEFIAVLFAEGSIRLASDLGAEQRRLRREHPPGLEQGFHVFVEQRQYEASNMAAVDIRVTQDDDAPIAGCVEVKVLA